MIPFPDRGHVGTKAGIRIRFARLQEAPRPRPPDQAQVSVAPVSFAQDGIEMHAPQHEKLRHMPAAFGAAQIGLAEHLAKTIARS